MDHVFEDVEELKALLVDYRKTRGRCQNLHDFFTAYGPRAAIQAIQFPVR